MKVVSRFAPSPTGYLHVGNARAAIITWLFVRKLGGEFILRIDDSDAERSKQEYEDEIEASLKWMGLNWDRKERQKDRGARYAEVIQELKDKGRLYPCYETKEELDLQRKTLLGRKLPPIYDRSSLKLSPEQIAEFESQGRKPHWRFKLEHEPIEWDDLIRGPVSFKGQDMSDPVLIREDGRPLYHLCSVIDDIDYNVTHIVRGEDHVSNTAAHVQMFKAIGADVPICAHLPLISDADGGKLSKRIGSLSMKDLREEEELEPMSLISLMARMGSSDPIEAFTKIEDVIPNFDFSKFSRNTPKFDIEELRRLNAKILHETAYEDVADRLPDTVDADFWLAVRPNLEKLSDIGEWARIAKGPVETVIEDTEYTTQAASLLPPAPWDKNTWSTWISAIKDTTGRKGKELFMPLRLGLTGMQHGPELANMLPLIGREEAIARLTGQNSSQAA